MIETLIRLRLSGKINYTHWQTYLAETPGLAEAYTAHKIAHRIPLTRDERGVVLPAATPESEIAALRDLAATCYAGLGAEHNLPEAWLDALSAASEGHPFTTEGLLPYSRTADSLPWVPVVAEWQASSTNGRSWHRVDRTKNESVSQRVAYLRTLTRVNGSPAYLIRALYAGAHPTGEPAWLTEALAVLADIRKDVAKSKFGGLQCDELERQLRALDWQA